MSAAIAMLSVDQVKEYLNSHRPDSFTILDVRQDWEYEEFHLPGARLIPLVELADRLKEVDAAQSVLVYCASGGRSMAAATLLEGQGYSSIMNMVGGAMAWQGDIAYGPIDLGMIEFSGTETPVEVVLKAYAMEHNLQTFYQGRADVAETLERIELFMELAGFEDRHKDTLYELYKKFEPLPLDRQAFEDAALATTTASEGGVDMEAFMEEFGGAFDADLGVFQIASIIEAQALDYYLRCAHRAEGEDVVKALNVLAREEKAHLKILGKWMDKKQM